MFDKINEGRWWDFGWQLVEGCTRVSPACLNCWSLAKERRFRKETGVIFHPERLERPFHRKKPASFAIWNDLFHESVHFQCIDRVIDVIRRTKQHTYLILTKRPERMLEYFTEHVPQKYMMDNGNFLDNIWLGVTCENQEMADKRIPILLQIPAVVKFVSCEPLLSSTVIWEYLIPGSDGMPEEVERYHDYIDWVIAGPETGPKARPCEKEWIELLHEQCKSAGVPFFDKKDILGLGIKEFPNINQ